MRLSILIPVYNVEQYLSDCLVSIDVALKAVESPEPFEIIFIDDASTDNSSAILQRWCGDHPSARIITHSENRGLAQARTTAIRVAQGDYVAWVDSDDTVEPDWFREIVAALDSNADLIAFEHHFVGFHLYEKTYRYGLDVLKLVKPQFIPVPGYADQVLTSISVGGYCWNKVIRRTLLANGYDAPRGALEDQGAMFDVLAQVKSVYYIPKALVNYHYRANGLLATFSDERCLLHYDYILPKMRKLPDWLVPSAEYAIGGIQRRVNRLCPERANYAILRRTLWRRLCDKNVYGRYKLSYVIDSFSGTAWLHIRLRQIVMRIYACITSTK